ncbi:MAG: hypothetical protein JHC31_00175 [Sulfurihydrogenibium sp.]|nr:hypothetical protein [Sulfurihydrogenibium sp.]
MKKALILFTLLGIGISYAENLPPLPPPTNALGPFTGLEATVGYIQKENGEKFLVVETPEGTNLVKVKTDKRNEVKTDKRSTKRKKST